MIEIDYSGGMANLVSVHYWHYLGHLLGIESIGEVDRIAKEGWAHLRL